MIRWKSPPIIRARTRTAFKLFEDWDPYLLNCPVASLNGYKGSLRFYGPQLWNSLSSDNGAGGDDRRVLLWQLDQALHEQGQPAEMKGHHISNIFCLAFNSDNTRIFSAGNDEQVILHDTASRETKDVFRHEDAVYGLSVDPNNDNVFASACDDGRVLIWDIRENPSAEPFCLANYTSAFHAVVYNPVEPRLLATANSKEGIALWDIRKPRSCVQRFGGSLTSDSAMSVKFNGLGTQVMGLRRRLPPVLYNLHSPAPACQFDHPGYYNSCTMKSCCFAGDRDQYLLSGSDDFNLYLWRIPEDTELEPRVVTAHMVLKGHRSIVNQVRFNPATHLVVSSGVEKVIKVWSPFKQPESGGQIEQQDATPQRSMYTHEEYISLVLNSGQGLSHDYGHQSVQEDPRMIAFFDSLVQREIEGWSSESEDSLELDEGIFRPLQELAGLDSDTAGRAPEQAQSEDSLELDEGIFRPLQELADTTFEITRRKKESVCFLLVQVLGPRSPGDRQSDTNSTECLLYTDSRTSENTEGTPLNPKSREFLSTDSDSDSDDQVTQQPARNSSSLPRRLRVLMWGDEDRAEGGAASGSRRGGSPVPDRGVAVAAGGRRNEAAGRRRGETSASEGRRRRNARRRLSRTHAASQPHHNYTAAAAATTSQTAGTSLQSSEDGVTSAAPANTTSKAPSAPTAESFVPYSDSDSSEEEETLKKLTYTETSGTRPEGAGPSSVAKPSDQGEQSTVLEEPVSNAGEDGGLPLATHQQERAAEDAAGPAAAPGADGVPAGGAAGQQQQREEHRRVNGKTIVIRHDPEETGEAMLERLQNLVEQYNQVVERHNQWRQALRQAQAGDRPEQQAQAGNRPEQQAQAGNRPTPQQAGDTAQAQARDSPAQQAQAGDRPTQRAQAGDRPTSQQAGGSGEGAVPEPETRDRSSVEQTDADFRQESQDSSRSTGQLVGLEAASGTTSDDSTIAHSSQSAAAEAQSTSSVGATQRSEGSPSATVSRAPGQSTNRPAAGNTFGQHRVVVGDLKNGDLANGSTVEHGPLMDTNNSVDKRPADTLPSMTDHCYGLGSSSRKRCHKEPLGSRTETTQHDGLTATAPKRGRLSNDQSEPDRLPVLHSHAPDCPCTDSDNGLGMPRAPELQLCASKEPLPSSSSNGTISLSASSTATAATNCNVTPTNSATGLDRTDTTEWHNFKRFRNRLERARNRDHGNLVDSDSDDDL
ncbi:DDB1- and CUL4-associated factor 5 [Branchiostoma belcheri]|nr:DDB1- and CUL4-associated factor 5 [Branchiostoma belcheri]